MKLTNKTKKDFLDFWQYWEELICHAENNVLPNENGEKQLCLPNQMMIACYAAHSWFSKKNKAKK